MFNLNLTLIFISNSSEFMGESFSGERGRQGEFKQELIV